MLEKYSHTDLRNVFSEFHKYMTDPVFICDSDFKIVYANEAFLGFTQKTMDQVINNPFGNVMGCMYIEKNGNDCGGNYYCKICKIRDAMKSCLSGDKKSLINQTVRDFKLSDEIIFRFIVFTTVAITFDNKPHVLVIITRSQSDAETIISE